MPSGKLNNERSMNSGSSPLNAFASVTSEKIVFRALLVLGLLLFGVMVSHLYSFGVDDSYIFYRYAENIAAGNGFVFNPQEPAGEGFTSWIWTLLLAFFHFVGIPTLTGSKIAGLVFHIHSAGAVFLIVQRINRNSVNNRIVALLISLAFLLDFRLIAHSLSGMETPLYVFALLILVYFTVRALLETSFDSRYWLIISLTTFGIFLVRPEGIVAGGVSLLTLLVKQPRDLFKLKTWIYGFAGLLFPIALFIVIKIKLFGYPLPHSFYHKFIVVGTEYREAVHQFIAFIKSYFPFILAGIVMPVYAAVKHKRIPALYFPFFFFSMTGVYLFFYPVMNYLHRFYIPYTPLLLIGLSFGIVFLLELIAKLTSSYRIWSIPLSVILILAVILTGVNWEFAASQKTVDSWTHLVNPAKYRAHLGVIMAGLPKEITVANSEMGVIPYYANLTCIDMAGLTDPHIAHHGLDMNYLQDRKASLILFPRDVSKIGLDQWKTFGIKYDRIFCSPKFKTDFELIGSFDAWPDPKKKYFIYADKTSPYYTLMIRWRDTHGLQNR